MNYDIIGDLHGHADQLSQLLEKLGYKKEKGIYQQAGHQAIFVGDFIDREAQQKAVIDIVRPMIDSKKALAVMGNHEFNAICYHTKHSERLCGYLRCHTLKNTEQHEAFLEEYPLARAETNELIEWFKTLPLFLELDGFRVIHACWDQKIIDDLKQNNRLTEDNCLVGDYYLEASTKGSELYQAIEVLLKGKEMELPEGISFNDKDGKERHEIRIKWWDESLETYQQASVSDIPSLNNFPAINIPKENKIAGYPNEDKPVFFGHYWFSGEPGILKDNAACLDYSVGNKEKLVCYQWNQGDTKLSNNNFVMVDA